MGSFRRPLPTVGTHCLTQWVLRCFGCTMCWWWEPNSTPGRSSPVSTPTELCSLLAPTASTGCSSLHLSQDIFKNRVQNGKEILGLLFQNLNGSWPCTEDYENRTNTYEDTSHTSIAQSVQRLVTGCTVRGSNPGGGQIIRTRPDRPWGPPSLLYSGYRVTFPGVKRPGRGIDHPPHLGPRSKKEQSYNPIPPLGLRGVF